MQRTYYVAFQKSSHQRPWHIFTRGGYEHIFLLYPQDSGTIKINPLSMQLLSEYIPCPPEQLMPQITESPKIMDVVKIVLPLSSNLSYNIRGLINCVTIVKFVLGITKWFILTPRQLHRHLLKIGGRSVKYGRRYRFCFGTRESYSGN